MPSDPKNYRVMSEPFATHEEAQKAYSAFVDELTELRKKHRMRDVVCICCFGYQGADGEESDSIGIGQLGNTLQAETLAAYALGTFKAETRERLDRLMRGVR